MYHWVIGSYYAINMLFVHVWIPFYLWLSLECLLVLSSVSSAAVEILTLYFGIHVCILVGYMPSSEVHWDSSHQECEPKGCVRFRPGGQGLVCSLHGDPSRATMETRWWWWCPIILKGSGEPTNQPIRNSPIGFFISGESPVFVLSHQSFSS